MHLIQNSRRSRTKLPLEQKFLNRGNGQYVDVLPLARNYIANASCRFISNNPVAQDYEGVESRRPGVRSESMLQSFFSLLLQLLPLQLFQDHRDDNLEAVGMTVAENQASALNKMSRSLKIWS
jgi:hypothetical protein